MGTRRRRPEPPPSEIRQFTPNEIDLGIAKLRRRIEEVRRSLVPILRSTETTNIMRFGKAAIRFQWENYTLVTPRMSKGKPSSLLVFLRQSKCWRGLLHGWRRSVQRLVMTLLHEFELPLKTWTFTRALPMF